MTDETSAAKTASPRKKSGKKVARIKFISTYNELGLPKYLPGRHYQKVHETHAQALAGHAEEIEVDEEDAADADVENPVVLAKHLADRAAAG